MSRARPASPEEACPPARPGSHGGREAGGGADPGPPLSGAPCPTHPLPEARDRSPGRRRPAARPSRPRGGAGAGGSAPRAVTACGRSRTRRRSALGGARPGRAARVGSPMIAGALLSPLGPCPPSVARTILW
ncbi:translation initiation factor IF-2-like [Ailuropoda melanoleuca]|uniref:translation initiation factor IF-2-like n=1 Tax=Ailuropoda melanoleuca TaxID=9646 RepID=UPI001494C97E|nr:translation initiation factor IF-2-like [Ailuropoda melanoleuca]